MFQQLDWRRITFPKFRRNLEGRFRIVWKGLEPFRRFIIANNWRRPPSTKDLIIFKRLMCNTMQVTYVIEKDYRDLVLLPCLQSSIIQGHPIKTSEQIQDLSSLLISSTIYLSWSCPDIYNPACWFPCLASIFSHSQASDSPPRYSLTDFTHFGWYQNKWQLS